MKQFKGLRSITNKLGYKRVSKGLYNNGYSVLQVLEDKQAIMIATNLRESAVRISNIIAYLIDSLLVRGLEEDKENNCFVVDVRGYQVIVSYKVF